MLGVMAITWQNKPLPLRPFHPVLADANRSDFTLKISYLSLHLLDLMLTLFAVNLGFMELNPFIKGVLASPLQLVVIKFLIPLLIVRFIPAKLLIPGILLLSMVVSWNIKELCFLLV